MAADHSFDIVSEIDLNEMHNAIMQAQKELATRFDFRGSSVSIGDLDRKEKMVTLTADNEPQLEAVFGVLIPKMVKRSVDPKCLDRQKLEQATHKTIRQKVKLKSGIDKDTAKIIQKQIKELGLKVNATIQGDELRVTSSKIDDLQAVQTHLRTHPPTVPVQFKNYK